jgi:hypothetical protein
MKERAFVLVPLKELGVEVALPQTVAGLTKLR